MGPRTRGFVAMVFCLATVGLAACGGGSDESSDQLSAQDQAEAKAVLAVGQELETAYKKKDAAGICGLMVAADVKKQFGGQKSCVKRLNAAFNQTDVVPDFSFDNVTVDGDTAVATAEQGESSSGNTINLKKVDGEWKIDLTPQSGKSSSDPSKAQ